MPRPEPNVATHSPSGRSSWIAVILIGVVSSLYFGYGLKSEPTFADEWAYIAQSYYAELFFDGYRDHLAWLDYAAYDLPPLPKYLIGASLIQAKFPLPGPADAWKWYNNINYECGPRTMLLPARIPSLILGALGCVALYGIGSLAFDRRTGVVAALLLMLNPLYRMHARRAMSDVIAEALILLSVFFALWAWKQFLTGRGGLGRWLSAIVAGILAGGAALAKLNGGLAMIHFILLVILAGVLSSIRLRSKILFLSSGVIAGIVSLMTFVAINPFITAHPRQPLAPPMASLAKMAWWERAWYLVTFRADVSRSQQKGFESYALRTGSDKLKAVVVQGFGRFGPWGPHASDSTRRYDLAQDVGAFVWLPWVLGGGYLAWRQGRRQYREGELPTTWGILAISMVSLVAVTSYLPLAWDRYYMSLQPWAALLGATLLVYLVTVVARGFRGMNT